MKGIHQEGLRVLGKPEDFAQYYYEAGADELIYQDVVASLFERNSLHEFISRTAKEIFVPLTVGGGLRTLDDISAALAVGADKVSINTAAIRNPRLIEEAALRFGSSTIVVAIEAIQQADGSYLTYTDNGREHTGVDAIEWAERVEKLGAGEIIATSVDREGTGEGFDLELTREIARVVSIPVIAHGGAGKVEHISEVIRESNVDAVAIASILHYGAVTNMVSVNGVSVNGVSANGVSAKGVSAKVASANRVSGNISAEEGNTEFLKSGKTSTLLTPASIHQVKQHMASESIPCRIESA